ncbi:MAG: hypothetical protein LBV58_02230 [Acholeplasmatales bacterium]|jgi:hypothetical protein|nr:hypothetical protein [Acholeplasmatales bacterium]
MTKVEKKLKNFDSKKFNDDHYANRAKKVFRNEEKVYKEKQRIIEELNKIQLSLENDYNELALTNSEIINRIKYMIEPVEKSLYVTKNIYLAIRKLEMLKKEFSGLKNKKITIEKEFELD